MKDTLYLLVASRAGTFLVLLVAASLEVFGDACFQTGLHRSTGTTRTLWFLSGIGLLAVYGLFVNLPQWDFGRLLGVYVALFFLVAQIVARLRFGQSPTTPVLVGGALIVAGGLVITLWKP